MAVGFGDVVRATVEMDFVGVGAFQNVYHMQNAGSEITDAQAMDDVVEILEALMTLIAGMLAVLQVVNGVRAVNVTDSTDVGFGTFVDDTPFTGTTQKMAPQEALGVNLYTSRLNVMGRKYFGAVTLGALLDNGVLTGASLTNLGNLAEDMTEVNEAVNTDWEFGVIASFDGVFLPFESYSLPLAVIIQRRRRAGVGI